MSPGKTSVAHRFPMLPPFNAFATFNSFGDAMALGDTTHVDTSAANTPGGPLGRWFHEISHCHSLEDVPGDRGDDKHEHT